MSGHRVVRAVAGLAIAVPLALSGTYVMVYLYRWEWNRALISGMFFIAGETALLGSVVLARLGRLERRLDALAAAPARGPTGDTDRAVEVGVDVDRESPFAWLDPVQGQLNVFVPLLLGAGVVLSALAFVVEQVSAAVTSVHTSRFGRGNWGHSHNSRGQIVTAAAAVALGAALLVPAVDRLGDATQTRPDPTPDRTVLEVDVRVRDGRGTAVEEATALWLSCRVGHRYERVDVTPTRPGVARLSLVGVLGTHQRRELTGCLQDATLELVRADIVTLVTTPVPHGGDPS